MKKFLAVLLMLAMLLCGAAFAEDTAPRADQGRCGALYQ